MKLNLSNIKWLVIISLIVYIIFLQQCNDCEKVEKIVKIETITKSDTVRIYDTITKKIPVYISKPKIIYVKDSLGNDLKLNSYTTEVEDSIIKGSILSSINGTLVNQSLEYKLKIPILTKITDSVFINTEKIINKDRNFLFIGAEIGGNQRSFNLSPKIGLYTKKGYVYDFRYGLLDKTYNFSISKSINIKK